MKRKSNGIDLTGNRKTPDLSPIHLKILGTKNAPIAIESQGKTFAPLIDAHHNIRRLIDLGTHQKVAHYDFTAFGEELVNASSVDNPWRFASKRLDPDLNLIAFAKRYYDPELALWMSKDPAGFLDSVNPYQYVFNNPFRYADPQGEFIFALPLLFMGSGVFLPSLTTIVTPIVYGALISAIAYTGYKVVESFERHPNEAMPKIIDVYAPDRPLPSTQDGVPIPDTDAPHTQLGKREGRRGKYTKAREFNKDGKPVRDIEFTDHGRPDDHTCPHQHKYERNKTGGTNEVKKQEPLPEWRYE